MPPTLSPPQPSRSSPQLKIGHSHRSSKCQINIFYLVINIRNMIDLNPNQQTSYDLIVIRHGQSDLNRGYHDYRLAHSLDLDWNQCLKIEDLNETVLYSQQYFDCHLTRIGVQQCWQARKMLSQEQPEIVLVSPYQRTLETCREIFGGREIKVVVHPLLAEVFRFSCDIGGEIEGKRNQFKDFDFSNMKDFSEVWFIEHLAPHHQQTWKRHIQKNQGMTFRQKQETLLAFMKEKTIYESSQELRERTWKIKQMLLQYRKQYKKIAVVTHYHVMATLLAESFSQSGEPIAPVQASNARPYFHTLQHLLNYK